MTLYREQRVVRKEYNYQGPVQFIRKIHGVLYPLAFLFYIIGVFGAIAVLVVSSKFRHHLNTIFYSYQYSLLSGL